MPEATQRGIRMRVVAWLGIPEGRVSTTLRLVLMIFFTSLAMSLMKAAQSGIFLETFSRDMIPWAFGSSALTLTLWSSTLVASAARLGPARLAQWTVLLVIVALVVLRGFLFLHTDWVRFATYVVIEASSGVLIIQVWSVASAATNARSARKILPIAGLGAGAAWTIGGLVVPLLAQTTGAESLLIGAPVLLGVAFFLLRLVLRLDLDDAAWRRKKRVSLISEWRAGFRFVGSVPLMRLSAALAVLALVSEQLMDFELMAAAKIELVNAEAISSFFGGYYAITSAIGMVLMATVSGRLLAALGATRSLFLTPAVVSLAAVVTLIAPSLATAVMLRGVARVLKQSVWSASSEQMQTAISGVRRSQGRAAIRGVIAPMGYALTAGLLALLPSDADPRILVVATIVVCGTMAFVISRKAKQLYLGALHRAVDSRQLELGPGRGPATPALDADACQALAVELSSDDVARAELAAQILGNFLKHQNVGSVQEKQVSTALRAGLSHATREVRLVAVEGLAHCDAEAISEHVAQEKNSEVRRACYRALAFAPPKSDISSALTQNDEDPLTDAWRRTAAVLRLPSAVGELPNEQERFLPLLKDATAVEVALSVLPADALAERGMLSQLSSLLEGGSPEVKLATAETIVRLSVLSLLPDVVRLLKDPRTASQAARLLVDLTHLNDRDQIEVGEKTLAGSLSRLASRIAHSESPPIAEKLVLSLLRHRDREIRFHATRALGAGIREGRCAPLSEEVVGPLIDRDLSHAYRLYWILAGLAHDDGVPDWQVEPAFEFLALEVDLRIEMARKDVLSALLLQGRQRLVSAVEVGSRQRSASRDAQMAELLEVTLDRELGRRVVPLFERLTLRERCERSRRLGYEDDAMKDPLDAIMSLGDPHLKRCAEATYGTRFTERYPEAVSSQNMVPIFERMRFIRSVPIFRDLSGDDIFSLSELISEVEFQEDEVIFSKGDPGEALYVVVSGCVDIKKDGATVASMASREFFGELALLDHQARSADAVCSKDTQLLRLRGADFEELMARRPDVTRQIVRVLAQRLRASGATMSPKRASLVSWLPSGSSQ